MTIPHDAVTPKRASFWAQDAFEPKALNQGRGKVEPRPVKVWINSFRKIMGNSEWSGMGQQLTVVVQWGLSTEFPTRAAHSIVVLNGSCDCFGNCVAEEDISDWTCFFLKDVYGSQCMVPCAECIVYSGSVCMIIYVNILRQYGNICKYFHGVPWPSNCIEG